MLYIHTHNTVIFTPSRPDAERSSAQRTGCVVGTELVAHCLARLDHTDPIKNRARLQTLELHSPRVNARL